MLKTILVLPDGSQLSSGTATENAIRSVTLTQCVNDSRELNPGSVCAAMLEAQIITPAGGLQLDTGSRVRVYRERDGVRYDYGIFILEQPTRPSANLLSITAYDLVSLLDKDLTDWLTGLTGWPYRLYDLAVMVCQACGLELENDSFPNADFAVPAFTAQGITGRQLISWAAQAAGRFCRATPEGKLEFAWYTPTDTVVGPVPATVTVEGETLRLAGVVGTLTEEDLQLQGLTVTAQEEDLTITAPEGRFFFMGGLQYEDYTVAPIGKVQVQLTEHDVGAVYPDKEELYNTYAVTGNYLLTASMAQALEPVAETLYEQLKDWTYTPCTLTMPADPQIRAGDILTVTDPNGKTFTTYVMTKKQSGQTDTITCTGSPRRDSSSAVNHADYKAVTGKVLELRADIEGLRAENRNAAGDLVSVRMEVSGITTQVARQEQRAEGLQQQLTALSQTAQGLSVEIKTMVNDGVSKVTTSQKRYSLSDRGLDISSDGDEIGNRIDHQGMCVSRGSTPVLKATAAGVEAIDITVHNYLVVGAHARLEDYTDGLSSERTACFFL